MSTDRKPLSTFWTPKYWPTWFGIGVLRLICLLPRSVSMGIGRMLGRLTYVLGARRDVVRRNLELCFPELSEAEREALIRDHYQSLGMAVIEMGLGRWATDRTHLKIGKLIGLEHLHAALESGRGVILLSAHFTTIEISGRVLALNCPPFDAVFRKNRSDFITELQRAVRERSADDTIEKRDIKKMVRNLRKGRAVWYAPDQSYDRKGAEVIEFFGIPSMHTTATSTLARLGRAVTLPFFPRRLENGHYEFTILPPLADFPSDDEIADTRKYVAVLEEQIRKAPEQYLWTHRKFKNLPEGYPEYYADLEASK